MKSVEYRLTYQCLHVQGNQDTWVYCELSQLEPGDVFRVLNYSGVVILFNGKDRLVFRRHLLITEYLDQVAQPNLWTRIVRRLTPPVAI